MSDSEDPCTNRRDSDDTTQQTAEEIEEGYQTPTSEEHKIPAVRWSCPPPPPKKRKRLFIERRIDIRKVGVVVSAEEIEAFFNSLGAAPPPPPPSPPVAEPEPEPEPEQGSSPKKIRSD